MRVTLPPGCTGLDMEDGTRYTAGRDGQTRVADRHVRAIRSSRYGQAGVMVVAAPISLGTKTGRWCTSCTPARLWNAWNESCPRCGAPTVEETAT